MSLKLSKKSLLAASGIKVDAKKLTESTGPSAKFSFEEIQMLQSMSVNEKKAFMKMLDQKYAEKKK